MQPKLQDTDPLVIQDPPGAVLTRHRRPLHALTGVRFFAALWVVFFHTRTAGLLTEHGYPHASIFFAHGYTAVALFFVLSGFILAYTYRDRMESSKRFWQARFARLWPAWVLSIVVIILCFGVPKLFLLIMSLCMVQSWDPLHPEYAAAVNFPGWTISVEAFFYLTFPFLQRWIQRLSARSIALVAAATLLLCLATDSANVQLSPTLPLGHLLPFPLYRVPEFILGVAMGNLFLAAPAEIARLTARMRSMLTYSGALLFFAVGFTIVDLRASLMLIPIVLLLFGLASEDSVISKFLGSKVVVFGGAISYSVYLLQISAKYLSRPLMEALGVHSLIVTMASVPLLLIAMAIPAYLLVEEPSRRTLRAFFARMDAKSSA